MRIPTSLLSLLIASSLALSAFALSACGAEATAVPDRTQIDAGERVRADARPIDPPKNQCDFTNCNGCCDGDTCVEDLTQAKCGENGQACKVCDDTKTCSGGACVTETASCIPTDADSEIPGERCDGCCMGDQCLEGVSKNACGAFGESCVACPGDETCDGLDCSLPVASCEDTCTTGCCTANGDCVEPGQQNLDACGLAGAACGVCPSDNECSSGTCVPPTATCADICTNGCCTPGGSCVSFTTQDEFTCGQGGNECSTCPSPQGCIEGSCEVPATYRLFIVSVVISGLDENGDEWDNAFFANVEPDGFVGASLQGDLLHDWYTATINDDYTPVFNDPINTYYEDDLLLTGLQVSVRESDGFSYETVGDCDVTILMEDLVAGTKIIENCGALATDLVLEFKAPL